MINEIYDYIKNNPGTTSAMIVENSIGMSEFQFKHCIRKLKNEGFVKVERHYYFVTEKEFKPFPPYELPLLKVIQDGQHEIEWITVERMQTRSAVLRMIKRAIARGWVRQNGNKVYLTESGEQVCNSEQKVIKEKAVDPVFKKQKEACQFWDKVMKGLCHG